MLNWKSYLFFCFVLRNNNISVLFFLVPSSTAAEYHQVMPGLLDIVEEHKKNLVPGKPQLDWCDQAVQVGIFLTFICS